MGNGASRSKYAGEDDGVEGSIHQLNYTEEPYSLDLSDPRSPSSIRRTPLHTPERVQPTFDPRSPSSLITRTPVSIHDHLLPFKKVEASSTVDPRSPMHGRTPLKLPEVELNGADEPYINQSIQTQPPSSVLVNEESVNASSTTLHTITEEELSQSLVLPARKDASLPRKRKSKHTRVDYLFNTPPLKKSYSEPISSENIPPSFTKKISSPIVPRTPLSPLTSRSMNTRYTQRERVDLRLDETVS